MLVMLKIKRAARDCNWLLLMMLIDFWPSLGHKTKSWMSMTVMTVRVWELTEKEADLFIGVAINVNDALSKNLHLLVSWHHH